MSDKHESMNGIIKLYELRREPVMREAREWMSNFYADSFQDIVDLFKTEDERYFRMAMTYWDMAAAFVNHGIIEEQLFNETNGEHISTFAKIEPFIGELREMLKNEQVLTNLEKLVLRIPNAKGTMTHFREQAKEKQTTQHKAAASA